MAQGILDSLFQGLGKAEARAPALSSIPLQTIHKTLQEVEGSVGNIAPEAFVAFLLTLGAQVLFADYPVS